MALLLTNIILSVILIFCYFLFPASTMLCIIIGVLELCIITIFIIFVRKKRSFINFIAPLIVLLCIAISNCSSQILNSPILLIVVSSCCGLIITLFAYQKNILDKSYNVIKIIIIFVIWSLAIFGTTLYINKTLDYSNEYFISDKIIQKEINAGRGVLPQNYYLYVSQWTPKKVGDGTLSVEVSKTVYENVKVGETIKIGVREGLFKIPYYYFVSSG